MSGRIRRYAPAGPVRIDTCIEAIPAISGEDGGKVTDVRVDGDRASGSIEEPKGGSLRAIKEDGEWRIGPSL